MLIWWVQETESCHILKNLHTRFFFPDIFFPSLLVFNLYFFFLYFPPRSKQNIQKAGFENSNQEKSFLGENMLNHNLVWGLMQPEMIF